MLDTLQPQTLTSYINEIRKIDPVEKPAIITSVKAQVKITMPKKTKPEATPDLPFETWNLPPQPEGYIKCNRYDFL